MKKVLCIILLMTLSLASLAFAEDIENAGIQGVDAKTSKQDIVKGMDDPNLIVDIDSSGEQSKESNQIIKAFSMDDLLGTKAIGSASFAPKAVENTQSVSMSEDSGEVNQKTPK